MRSEIFLAGPTAIGQPMLSVLKTPPFLSIVIWIDLADLAPACVHSQSRSLCLLLLLTCSYHVKYHR